MINKASIISSGRSLFVMHKLPGQFFPVTAANCSKSFTKLSLSKDHKCLESNHSPFKLIYRNTAMKQDHNGNTHSKSGMTGLMMEYTHSKKRTYTASQQRHSEEYDLRDPPPTGYSSLFIYSVKNESENIHK